MKTEDETATLLKKIEQQDDLIQKLRSEEAKLKSYIQQFKQSLERKVQKEYQSSSKPSVDEDKIQKQIERELQNAKSMHKNYQNELKVLQKKANKNKFTADSLLEMENQIKNKELQIRDINDDIKNLHIVKRKQEKLIQKKQKNEDGAKLSKLVDQIRKQRQILEALKLKHQHKSEALSKRKQAIADMEHQYSQKCKKFGEKPLTFEEFKEKRIQKKRQESVQKIVQIKKDPRKQLTIKQIINSHLDVDAIEINQKNLNQLVEKKTVAQNSLKIARKKHERQLEELQERAQQLRTQSSNLNTKYLQKKKQKELIETTRTINFKRNSSKTMKKLDPIK